MTSLPPARRRCERFSPARPPAPARAGPAAALPPPTCPLRPGWRPCPRPAATAGSPGAHARRANRVARLAAGALRMRRPGRRDGVRALTLPAHAHGLPATGCNGDRSRPLPTFPFPSWGRGAPPVPSVGSGALPLLGRGEQPEPLPDRTAAPSEANLARSGRAAATEGGRAPEEAAATRPPSSPHGPVSLALAPAMAGT